MPRTLNADLLAAMNSGSFTPWFKVQLLDADRVSVLYQTEEVLGFELDGLTAKVEFHDPNNISEYTTFRILRGITVNGIPNYVTSSQFYPTLDRHEKRIRSLEGHVFPGDYFTSPGDVTYSQVINAVCSEYGLTPVYANPAAAWLNYQFYPTGRIFTLNNVRQFFTVLRQKYLIFATDYDNDNLFFYQAVATVPPYPAGYISVNPGLALLPGIGSYKEKSFLSRDEANTTHTSGALGKPLHNLGFLHSTAAHPARYSYTDTNDWIVRAVPPNLKYLDFDSFKVNFDIFSLLLFPAKVKEIYNQKLHPSWQWQMRFLDIFGNTEGGSIPSIIEASAPYTPINVTNFDKNLNSTINNLQALADKVDELDCGPAIYADTNKPVPDDADLFPLVDSDTVTHLVRNTSWTNIKTALKAVNDGLYQPLTTIEREVLQADRHYHVRVDGNDANTGLVDSAGGAFLTIQRAVNVISMLDINGHNVRVEVGNGTYTTPVVLPNVVGFAVAGNLVIAGNNATPANVIISTTSATCFSANGLFSTWDIVDLKVQTTTSGNGLYATNGSKLRFGNLIFGVISGTTSYHIRTETGASITCLSNYAISGGARAHFFSTFTSFINVNTKTITLSNTPAFAVAFAYSTFCSGLQTNALTFPGSGATGKRYDVQQNSVVNTSGGGANYFPGNAAGTTATGGVYA